MDANEEGEEFDDVAGNSIEPQEVQVETNKDSGDEELDPGSANRLSDFQLQARAHLLQRNRDSDSDNLNLDDAAQTQMAQAQTLSSISKRRKQV